MPGQSYIEKQTDMMHQLLWKNLLEDGVRAAILGIPFVGPFLTAFPPFMNILLFFISKYVEVPLFLALTRFGVFTSIDWQDQNVYNAYAAEAAKLIPLQDKDTWTSAEEKAFTDAARNLIRFHVRS